LEGSIKLFPKLNVALFIISPIVVGVLVHLQLGWLLRTVNWLLKTQYE
jgi:hypothetical protein